VTLIVCSLRLVDEMIAARRPSHLITLLSPTEMIDEHRQMGGGRHLRVGVNDIAEPMDGLIAPDETMVERILDFGSGWTGASPMLIHCWAGISRSSATAFILACARNPETTEKTIAGHIRAVSPIATPNPRLVGLADDMLGRGGRMADAVDAIGRGEAAFENQPFEVPLRFDPNRTPGA
jgi:predicted protein tyrosine phosphatase